MRGKVGMIPANSRIEDCPDDVFANRRVAGSSGIDLQRRASVQSFRFTFFQTA
jgi:hypothetical protein